MRETIFALMAGAALLPLFCLGGALSPEEERRLIERARNGDRAAFDRLVQRHREALKRALHSMLRLSEDDAEDVANETLARAWWYLNSFQGKAAFLTWMCGVGKNIWFTRRQKEKRLVTTELDAMPRPEAADPASETDSSLVEKAGIDLLLEGLSEREKAVVIMSSVHDMSHQESAETLGISVVNSRAILARALRRLRG